MAKTIKDLALALLNATLILVALCLFLAWKTASTVDGMMMDFASNLEIITPMRDDVQTMTDEVRGLRGDLASLKDGDYSPEIMDRIQARMQQVETRMDTMNQRLDNMQGLPQSLLDQSIDRIGQSAADTVNGIRGCVPPAGV